MYVKLTSMTNYSLVGDHQVSVVNDDEVVLEGFDMSGINLNGFLVKRTCPASTTGRRPRVPGRRGGGAAPRYQF